MKKKDLLQLRLYCIAFISLIDEELEYFELIENNTVDVEEIKNGFEALKTTMKKLGL